MRRLWTRSLVPLVFAGALLVGGIGIYVAGRRPDNNAAPPRAIAAAPSDPGLAAYIAHPSPEALPDIAFEAEGGAARSLHDFKGKIVLLNLWATWCVPCRKEMPSLDALQSSLGSDKFEVVALAVDHAGAAAAQKFLTEAKATHLKLYVDPTGRLGGPLKVVGMPTSLLIDGTGRELGRIIGPAEWNSDAAQALIAKALAARG